MTLQKIRKAVFPAAGLSTRFLPATKAQAKEIVGDEPFAVLLPDDIVDATVPCMKQMVEAFNETQSTILASEVIEGPAISAYGVLDCIADGKNQRLLEVKHMVEKPKFED